VTEGWRPTETLVRALAAGAGCAVVAVAFGRPDLWVLGAPLLVAGVLALVRRPPLDAHPLRPVADLANRALREGQRTSVTVRLGGLRGAEQVTRTVDRAAFVTVDRQSRTSTRLCDPDEDTHDLVVDLTTERWGHREVGAGQAAATSPWAGWRWGPQPVPGRSLTVLPAAAGFASRAQAPHPLGLVGAHQSRRTGDGSEFAGIRPFAVGDRLRRINWRVSLATGELHVVQTRAEEDTAVLLLVDALVDVGASGGVDGSASSLDLTVRAASALTEHHLRAGDRVGLRVLGPAEAPVGFGSGSPHRMRILHSLARIRPGHSDEARARRFRLHAPDGTVVLLLTPMLDELTATVAATVARSGLPLVVVDTLPGGAPDDGTTARARAIAGTAWRMRMVERDLVLGEVARAGCPVVPWRGPGTLDEVMRRLARRAQLPRVVQR